MNELIEKLDRHIFLAELCGVEYYPNRIEMYERLGYKATPLAASDDQCSVLLPGGEPWGVLRNAVPVTGTVICIRGTESNGNQMLADWGANMRVMRWYDKRVGWSQKGHLRGAQALREKITRQTYTLPLTLTGHSRGGGLAVMLACMLVREGIVARDWINVVTFGAPRVTMEGARKRLNSIRVVQYANAGDVVTKVMPRVRPVYPYRHINRVYTDRERSGPLEAHKISEYRYALMEMRDRAVDVLDHQQRKAGLWG